ncbi:hypothetical protein [Thauera sp. GDN1]|uniref:hypothetical protein n=1 Tax=Thauera sp. GDN1 TaxID=2944810 RepID=UPI002478B6F4|nr:hypothetical protein [Thauera sp. GDN1]
MEKARAVEQAMRWALWRLDDNGNRFVVAVFANRDEAEATARAFEAHGHKQTYWVEKTEGERPHP